MQYKINTGFRYFNIEISFNIKFNFSYVKIIIIVNRINNKSFNTWCYFLIIIFKISFIIIKIKFMCIYIKIFIDPIINSIYMNVKYIIDILNSFFTNNIVIFKFKI